MLQDARGIDISGASSNALDAYERAMASFRSYFGDPVEALDAALAESPNFIMAHLFKAIALVACTERQYIAPAKHHLRAAEALRGQATAHELALTEATRLLVNGHWAQACRALDAILIDTPRDALALQAGHLMDFYRGDALNLRNRITRVLPHWSASIPGYSFVLGMHAFGLEECNQYDEAEDAALRALALEPRDPWAIHAATHVMEMRGEVEAGIEWLESRIPDWAPDNGLACHNWWHLALFNLDRQNHQRVYALFDDYIHPQETDIALQLVDSCSLLWRLHLEGLPLDERAQTAADEWQRKLEAERDFYVFNDLHAMLALVMAQRSDAIARLRESVAHSCDHGIGDNRRMSADIGLALCDGIIAFGQQRYGEAADLIDSVRDHAHGFGGSHAQRDLLSLTLIEACLRSGQHRRARHYCAERCVHKPASASGWRLLARAQGSQ